MLYPNMIKIVVIYKNFFKKNFYKISLIIESRVLDPYSFYTDLDPGFWWPK